MDTFFNSNKIKAGGNDGHRQVQRKWRTLNVKYELYVDQSEQKYSAQKEKTGIGNSRNVKFFNLQISAKINSTIPTDVNIN